MSNYSPSNVHGFKALCASLLSCHAVLALVTASLVAACVDSSAVQSFSKLAPDQSKLDLITAAYVDVPEKELELDVLQRIPLAERQALTADAPTRKQQAASLDKLHAVLVDYMDALGELANNQLVQTTTDTSTLTTGLTSLSTAEPQLHITSAEISGVGKVSTLLADAFTAHYRSKKLAQVIGDGQKPLHAVILIEEQVIQRGVIPDLRNLLDRTHDLNEVVNGLEVASRTEIAGAERRAAQRQQEGARAGTAGQVDVALQGSGAADVAALLLLRRKIDRDTTQITQEINAAQNYMTALRAIDTAYQRLCDQRNTVLTKAGAESFIQNNGQLLQQAYTTLQALKTL